MKKSFIVISLIAAIIISFFVGAMLTKTGIAKSVDVMQVRLRFNHLQNYRDLQSDLLSNCTSRLETNLEQIIDRQKMSMAEYVQSVDDEKLEAYINLRDSDLIEELRSYKINWKKIWTLPKCKSELTDECSTAIKISAPVCQSSSDAWTPRPSFTIEDSEYKETLNFISGISYALTYNNEALRSQGKESFFCLGSNDLIGAKEIIDLLNEKLTGDYSSEIVLETLTAQLINKYPCMNNQ